MSRASVMNPVYLERCKNCDHVQSWHIATSGADGRIIANGPYLQGTMVPCRFPGCAQACERWEPTW